MKHLLVHCGFILVTVAGSISAEPEAQPQMSITEGASDSWNFDWKGIAGRTYFFQYSQDLVNWEYAPFIGYGDGDRDGIHSYAMTCSTNKMFFRLLYDDRATVDPETDDFDGDGLSNLFEVKYLHTNPYVPNNGAVDSNGNGLADAWEMYWFHSLMAQSGDGDANGDGILNKYKQQANTDPTTDETAMPGNVFKYDYDSEGRLLTVDGKGSSEYTYDGEGNLESAQ
jgi:RHS Repeat/Bacterial TSP3 repeat